ncbi:hypothetical protein C0J52_01589 [Blattella germanica]|nr:hypothetical protein C0J52_01589 [Blattella germanica]
MDFNQFKCKVNHLNNMPKHKKKIHTRLRPKLQVSNVEVKHISFEIKYWLTLHNSFFVYYTSASSDSNSTDTSKYDFIVYWRMKRLNFCYIIMSIIESQLFIVE